jgi:hypothetical protein
MRLSCAASRAACCATCLERMRAPPSSRYAPAVLPELRCQAGVVNAASCDGTDPSTCAAMAFTAIWILCPVQHLDSRRQSTTQHVIGLFW